MDSTGDRDPMDSVHSMENYRSKPNIDGMKNRKRVFQDREILRSSGWIFLWRSYETHPFDFFLLGDGFPLQRLEWTRREQGAVRWKATERVSMEKTTHKSFLRHVRSHVPIPSIDPNKMRWSGFCLISVVAMRWILVRTARSLDSRQSIHLERQEVEKDHQDERDPLHLVKDLSRRPLDSSVLDKQRTRTKLELGRNGNGDSGREDDWWLSLSVLYIATMENPEDGRRGPYSINLTPFSSPRFYVVCFEDAMDAKNFVYLTSTMNELTDRIPGIMPESPKILKDASEEDNFKVVVFRSGELDLRPGVREEELYLQMVEKAGVRLMGDIV